MTAKIKVHELEN